MEVPIEDIWAGWKAKQVKAAGTEGLCVNDRFHERRKIALGGMATSDALPPKDRNRCKAVVVVGRSERQLEAVAASVAKERKAALGPEADIAQDVGE